MENHSATVLIIAHRLATVMDSDRILVMAKGTEFQTGQCLRTSVEYDHPFKLLV